MKGNLDRKVPSCLRCYITCSADFWGGEEFDFLPAALLRESCNSSDSNRIRLVNDPAEADVVLFAESNRDDARSGHFLENIIKTPVYREFASKTAVHSGRDFPFPVIPGIYPSLTSIWAMGLQCVGGPYIVEPNPYLNQDVGWDGEIRWLASFQGCSQGKPVRLRLLNLNSAEILIQDTQDEFVGALRENDQGKIAFLKRRFVCQMLESKFALCPSGAGASSFRIFEAMQLSRPPVIISDGWMPPPGPRWTEFAIFVRERDLVRLPNILKSREHEWRQMGHLAREAWDKFYSPTHIGETVMQLAFQSINSLPVEQFLHTQIARLQFFRFKHFRQWVRDTRLRRASLKS